MFENSTIPYTIIRKNTDETASGDQCKWSICRRTEDKPLTVKVENIYLKQEPHETLDLLLSISTLPSNARTIIHNQADYCTAYTFVNPHNPDGFERLNCFYNYTYTFALRFHNCLHEFSKNYTYGIACKIPGDRYDPVDKYFCYIVEPRLSDVIKTRVRMSIVNEDLDELENMYFCIRRHNVQESGGNETKICNIIPKLRHVGCDVVLEARDDRISTHKFILSQNSDVFSKMFTHQMKEEQNGVVNMSDFEAKVILKMLDYLYTGELWELGDMTLSLFKLAHMYQFNELCRRCEEHYMFNVKPNNDNIIEIMELAKLYDLKKLEQCTNDFIANHEQELIQLSSYQQYLCQSVDHDSVVDILLLAQKHNISDVKIRALNFIEANYDKMINNNKFMDLFVSNPELMREVYTHKFKKK